MNKSLIDDESDRMIDELFERVDSLCLDGHFDDIDKLLLDYDVENERHVVLLAVLCITRAAAEHLKHRDAFFERVQKVLIAERGEKFAFESLKNLRK